MVGQPGNHDSQQEREDTGEELRVVDTSHSLTKEELVELKRLASLSKTAKLLLGMVFAFLTIFKVPDVLDWGLTHLQYIKHP